MTLSKMTPSSRSGFSLSTQGCQAGTCGQAQTWVRVQHPESSDEQPSELVAGPVRT